jgi:hypothetical protein
VSVTEIKQALGGWELRLRPDTPREILDALTFYGHIAVIPGQVDPKQYGDNLLSTARYVGVYRGKDSQTGYTLKGSGMAFWLGDEDDKGDVFETAVTLTGATFAASLTALLPAGGAVIAGTLNAIAGTYTGKHQWETPRQAITYVTDTFGGEWRVNGNATLDAGTVAQLYNVTPTALVTPRGKGADLLRKALEGRLSMGVDVEDVTTRVVLLAEGSGESIATGSANAPATPFKDIRGNAIKATRIVSESGTESTNAAARAQLQLNRFVNARRSVELSSGEYDVKGTFKVGDYLDVYDPENGFYDILREVYWAGDRINPMALRCVEMTWPIPDGWTVAFRDINGVWIDLSRYYVGEGGDTTIVVGELARGLSSVIGEPIGVRPNLPEAGADFTVPAAPTWGTFSGGSYQPSTGEWTKSAILAVWTQPLNGDASTITDGGHYELRYRVNAFIGYEVRWGQLAGYRWGALSGNRWGAPITDPVSSGEWHSVFIPWGQTQMLIQELTPGVEYEFQIRAVDAADPPHQGPWSVSKFYVAVDDIFAPAQPAVPIVASSLIAFQIVHNLGKASGGTFNLEPDLAYLSVHVGLLASFLPDDSNMIGKLIANSGMIQAQIPAVGTLPYADTTATWIKVIAVDRSGNQSQPSAGVQSTIALIDDAHISDLTVSKVTAGTINAAWILAGSIKTANSGARVEVDAAGVRAYNSSGVNTTNIEAATGDATITGAFKTAVDGAGVEIVPGSVPKVILQPNPADDHYGQIFGLYFGTENATEMSIRRVSDDSIDGGKVLLMQSGAVLSHQPASPGVETYVGVGWPISQTFSGRGKMPGSFTFNDSLFYTAGTVVGAGFGAISLSYGLTMTSSVFPLYAISGATPGFNHCINLSTLTGYSVAWDDGAAHNVWSWVCRA